MKKLILLSCVVWSIVIFMIGFPSVKLPDGTLWITGFICLVVIAILPWLYPIIIYKKKEK